MNTLPLEGDRSKILKAIHLLQIILRGETPDARAQRMALFAFAIRIISAGIAFVSQIILARLMGSFEYGLFVFVWVIAILLGNFSCLGFHTTIIRFLPQYAQVGDFAKIRGLTSSARVFAMVLATAVAAIGIVLLHFFGSYIESYYVAPLFLAAFALPMIALGDIMEGTGRANAWAIAALTPTYIIRPTLIIVFMVIAMWLGYAHTAKIALISALAAAYVTSIGQFIYVTWRLRNNFPMEKREREFPVWFSVALPIFFIEGIGFLLTNADTVVVGFFMPPEKVGVYFAAAKTMALVHFVFFAVKAAASARYSAIMAEGQADELAAFAGRTARWTFWPSLAVGAVVVALGKPLLSLFGPEFIDGMPLMMILLAGILAKASIGPGEGLLTMAGEQQLCVKIYAIALTANILLNVTLIPLYGLVGGAIATAAAMCIETILLHLAVRSRLQFVLFAFVDPLKHRSQPSSTN